MSASISGLWHDQAGEARADYAIAFGVIVVAAVAWLAQMGGGDGMADALATLSWRVREFGRIGF